MKIHKYDSSNLPNDTVGTEIGTLLSNNYPESYNEEAKNKSLGKRNTAEKIRSKILSGTIFFTVQDTLEQVVGFLEMKQIRVEGGVYIQLCWLVVDRLYKGNGYASLLHEKFENEARSLGEKIKGNWCLQLGTGKQNPARRIYEKWGYKIYQETDIDVFMIKDINS